MVFSLWCENHSLINPESAWWYITFTLTFLYAAVWIPTWIMEQYIVTLLMNVGFSMWITEPNTSSPLNPQAAQLWGNQEGKIWACFVCFNFRLLYIIDSVRIMLPLALLQIIGRWWRSCTSLQMLNWDMQGVFGVGLMILVSPQVCSIRSLLFSLYKWEISRTLLFKGVDINSELKFSLSLIHSLALVSLCVNKLPFQLKANKFLIKNGDELHINSIKWAPKVIFLLKFLSSQWVQKVISFLRNNEANNQNFSIRKDEFTSFYAKHFAQRKKGNILHL